MKRMFTTSRIFVLVVLLGALLRVHGIGWDQGFHLHPDERAIVMAVDKLEYPKSIEEFLSPTSSWNPQFFAYGSFPMYLLQLAGNVMGYINPLFAEYTLINIVGRFISALFDLGTIILLYFIGRKLFHPRAGLFASFFYAISVLPIQLSHFYAVDTILTFFITASLYLLILFYEKPTIIKAIILGTLFGLALATKVSAIVLLVSIGAALLVDFLIVFITKPHKPKHYTPNLSKVFKMIMTYGVVILATALAAFIFFEPYALIDRNTFWEQTLYQSMMTKDALVFPYTLQYVGKIPYLYELQNIFLFGLGPILSMLCFIGMGYAAMVALRKNNQKLFAALFPIFAFFITYFFVVGGFAIGFMRYILPVYPILCLFGALFLFKLTQKLQKGIKNPLLIITASYILFLIFMIWPLSFMNIYSKNNTRYDATTWIKNNIPPGKTIAIEHWDDGLPLTGMENYMVLTLQLYDPDTDEKWIMLANQIRQTDYIIIASNRLTAPLTRLTDCTKLPPTRCYPRTAQYYQKLFSGELGFQKVAEFTSFPTVPLLNIPINDQTADESFTVYDHPKVMIFKKQ